MIILIAAVDSDGAISKNGRLPWNLPNDLKWFKRHTLGNIVVMGRKTFESIGCALPDRVNIVLSRNLNYKASDCNVAHSVEEVLKLNNEKSKIFIIGGAEIYSLFMPFSDKMYLTQIEHKFEGDNFFPQLDDSSWIEVCREKGNKDSLTPYDYFFVIYNSKSYNSKTTGQ